MLFEARAALVIAQATARESLRNRLLLVGVFVGIGLVAMSVIAASLSIGEQSRLIIDLGLAAVGVLGSIMTVALTVMSFAGEISKRTAFPVLARPISRASFILGKYLGVIFAMSIVVSTMIIATAITVKLYDTDIPHALWWQWLLSLVEICVVAAIAMLFSTLAVPVLAALYAAGFVIAGNLAFDIQRVAQAKLEDNVLGGRALGLASYVLPNLQSLSVRNEAANALPVSHAFIGNGIAYGIAYAIAVLILSMIVFSRRKAI